MIEKTWFIIQKRTSLGRFKDVVAVQGMEESQKELAFWRTMSFGSEYFSVTASELPEHLALISEAKNLESTSA